MKLSYCLLIGFSLLMSTRGYAQMPYVPARNAVQLGADFIGIDPANGLKFRYAAEYRRYFGRDKFSLNAAVGVVSSQRTTVLVPDYVTVGTNTRQRITLDLTGSYNLLRSVHHSLRVGAGPSVWYRHDDLFAKVDPYPIPTGTEPLIQRRQATGWNAGGHGTIEYGYALSLNTQVSLHTGAAIVGPLGFAPLFGMRAGYRF